MEFCNLHMVGKPLAETHDVLSAHLRGFPHGTRMPSQQAALKIFGISQSQYCKVLRMLRAEGVVTFIGHGVGYATGKLTPDEIEAFKTDQKNRGRELIKLTRKRSSIENGAITRHLRDEVRHKILLAIVKEGIDKHVVRALQDGDVGRMACCEKALKMVGCHYEQSSEAQAALTKQMAAAGAAIAAVNVTFQAAASGAQRIEAEIVETDS